MNTKTLWAAPALLSCLILAACSTKESPSSKAGVPNAEPAKTPPSSVAQTDADQGAAKAPVTSGAPAPAATPPAAKPAGTVYDSRLTSETPTVVPDPHAGHDHGPEGTDPAAFKGPPGKLVITTTDHDFGSMIEGEVAEHVFDMSSGGENPLVIHNAKPTCGCTVSKVQVAQGDGFVDYNYGDPIAVGTQIKLQARLNTKNKSHKTQSKINVYCNDPAGVITLGLEAQVGTYFTVTPQNLTFGDMSTEDTIEKSCTIRSTRGDAFKLLPDSESAMPGVTAELIPLEPDADGLAKAWEVKVRVGPGAREGNLGYPFRVRSDRLVAGAEPDPETGEQPNYGAQVMLTARVRGLISYEPQYLSFGLVRPGEQRERILRISSWDTNYKLTGEVPIRLVDHKSDQPFAYAEHFTTSAEVSEEGRTLDVKINLQGLPDTLDGAFQGRVLVETGHPSRPTVSVLFSGVCRRGVQAPGAPPPIAQPPGGGQ
jgi:hypothetical protein